MLRAQERAKTASEGRDSGAARLGSAALADSGTSETLSANKTTLRHGYVYLVRLTPDLFKIGCTAQMTHRLAQIRARYPEARVLTYVRIVPAGARDLVEREVQDHYRERHVENPDFPREIFALSPGEARQFAPVVRRLVEEVRSSATLARHRRPVGRPSVPVADQLQRRRERDRSRRTTGSAILLALVLVLALAVPAGAYWPVTTLMSTTLAGEVTGQTTTPVNLGRVESLTLWAAFVRAGGGTTAKAWVQTSFDGGTTWMDVASFAFTTTTANRAFHLTAAAVTSIATPGDAALADNTAVNGFLGPLFRVKLTTTGTYTGASSFAIYAVAK